MTELDGDLRWALAALELVANGLRSRRGLTVGDVEMINLNAAKMSIENALKEDKFVRVPREPTKAMIEAGTAAVEDGIDSGQDSYQSYDIYDSCDLANRAYRAMLAASPD